ncbi:hypothetical protein Bca4012_057438 [Brassica carinata]
MKVCLRLCWEAAMIVQGSSKILLQVFPRVYSDGKKSYLAPCSGETPMETHPPIFRSPIESLEISCCSVFCHSQLLCRIFHLPIHCSTYLLLE